MFSHRNSALHESIRQQDRLAIITAISDAAPAELDKKDFYTGLTVPEHAAANGRTDVVLHTLSKTERSTIKHYPSQLL